MHNTCVVSLNPKFMIRKDRRLSVKIKKKNCLICSINLVFAQFIKVILQSLA